MRERESAHWKENKRNETYNEWAAIRLNSIFNRAGRTSMVRLTAKQRYSSRECDCAPSEESFASSVLTFVIAWVQPSVQAAHRISVSND